MILQAVLVLSIGFLGVCQNEEDLSTTLNPDDPNGTDPGGKPKIGMDVEPIPTEPSPYLGVPMIAGSPRRDCPLGKIRIKGKCKLALNPCPQGQKVVGGICQNVKEDLQGFESSGTADFQASTQPSLADPQTSSDPWIHDSTVNVADTDITPNTGLPAWVCPPGKPRLGKTCSGLLCRIGRMCDTASTSDQNDPSGETTTENPADLQETTLSSDLQESTTPGTEDSTTSHNETQVQSVLFSISGAPLRACPPGQARIGGKCKIVLRPCPIGQKLTDGQCQKV